MDSITRSLYPQRIYTAKRIQEHLDSHLNKRITTTKRGKNYDLGTSLLPDILS
jgi:hypothetical protein